DAAGRVSVRSRSREPRPPGVRRDADFRAPSPPLRVQQSIPRRLRESGSALQWSLPAERSGRDIGDPLTSLVHRSAVPSGAEVATAARPSALPRLRGGGGGAPASQREP